MYEFPGFGDDAPMFSGGDVLSLQNAIIESSCQLLEHGSDGLWGSETEAGVRCLVGNRGRDFVIQSWPWVESRMTIPQVQAERHGADVVPWWFSWAAAGVGFVSIVAVGSIMTRGK